MNNPPWTWPDLHRLLAADIASHPTAPAGRQSLAPQLSYGRHSGPPRDDARVAAVIIALCWDGREWSAPLTVRSTGLARHGGQVSLPGGLVEHGETPREAAARELGEELGQRPPLEWIGEFQPLFVFASNVDVTPCVATISGWPDWKPQQNEVEAVLRMPLRDLLRDADASSFAIERGPLRFLAPRLIVEARSVWGATAVLLGELRERLHRIQGAFRSTRDASRINASLTHRIGDDPAAFIGPASKNFPQPARRLRAVTFDLDGLMVNTEEIYHDVGATLLRRRGKEITGELLDQMMGRQATSALSIMIAWHQLDATVEDLAAESAEILAALLPMRLAAMPGLISLLDALETAHIPKSIATSSGRAFANQVLGQLELASRFAFVLTGEDIQHGKPAPDVYALAARRHGVPPHEIMVLEDSQNGCQAAVAAGAYTVAVPHGQSMQHRFPGVQFVADSLLDPRIYEALGLQLANVARPSR